MLTMPLLNLLQTITLRLSHEQKHHDSTEHAAKRKEIVSTERRLGDEHRSDECHDVVTELLAN